MTTRPHAIDPSWMDALLNYDLEDDFIPELCADHSMDECPTITLNRLHLDGDQSKTVFTISLPRGSGAAVMGRTCSDTHEGDIQFVISGEWEAQLLIDQLYNLAASMQQHVTRWSTQKAAEHAEAHFRAVRHWADLNEIAKSRPLTDIEQLTLRILRRGLK